MQIGNSNGLHVIGIAALGLIVLVGTAKAADLSVTDAWIRALPTSEPSGGYFTLHNASTKVVKLTGASSPGCGMLSLHQSENMGGMMKMDDVASVDVPAGGTVKFAPGGYHLMCMNATKAIHVGGVVPVTLDFSDGQKVITNFSVKNAAGR